MKRDYLALDNYYHIYNRGVDKRQIYIDEEDHLRFLHNMYEFNDENHSPKWRCNNLDALAGHTPDINKEQKRIVDIACFCLMPNHFHFILKPLLENGVSLFIKKLCCGYAQYFNLKYDRSGTLFQGRFQSVFIKTDAQMMHLAQYIHVLNPGELVEPQIREGIIQNPAGLREFLRNYKWSSHLDFCGEKNYPSLINKDIIAGYFGSPQEYENFSMSWKRESGETITDLDFDI